MADNAGYTGLAQATDMTNPVNATALLVQSILARVSTAKLVQVMAVTNEGEAAAVGFVDVMPLVHQIDGQGQPTPHVTVYGLPYFRIQGGANAVIMDPEVGDLGLAIFADRDISAVKATKAAATPATRRRFDMGDGLYLGGFLNGVPTQFIRFSADGVEIKSTMVTVTGDLHVTGDIVGDGTATIDGVGVTTHHHTGVQAGGGNSGGPVG